MCGYFNLTAKLGETALGSAAVKIVPYDSFHTMQEIYEDLDNMVTYAADNTNLYVKKFSMGTSSGAIYEPLDMPYMILAKERAGRVRMAGLLRQGGDRPDRHAQGHRGRQV